MTRTVLCLLGGAIGAAVLGVPVPLAAQVNVAGSWRIEMNRCEMVDGERECFPSGVVLAVSQNGNRFSGTVLLPPDDIPAECDLICQPATTSCRLQARLDGTITDTDVELTITARQTVAADCGICTVQGGFDSTLRGRGKLVGGVIRGSFTEETTNECVGTEPCVSEADCTSFTASGGFVVRISGRDGTGPCVGDCNRNGLVAIDELITSVNVALGTAPPAACLEADADATGDVTVVELVSAVRAAVSGCLGPTPAACELGESCETGFDCPFVDCPDGATFACYFGRCLIGSCACSDDPQCCAP